MYRLPSHTITDIELTDMLEYERKQFSIRIDSRAVNRWAKIASIALFEHGGLFELDLVFAFVQRLQVKIRIAVVRVVLFWL